MSVRLLTVIVDFICKSKDKKLEKYIKHFTKMVPYRLLENATEIPQEQAVKKAFRGAETKEEFEQYKYMFDSYVRGGIEELHERLVVRKSDSDDTFYENKTANLMVLLERFAPI